MAVLPSGTVTFLFTDIEGSTRLWEEHPEAMRLALARHDELMRSAIDRHEGQVFKTIGDAFCAAFHTAPDALNAALATQLALATEAWPDGVMIKVRMALHTGAAEVRDHDYFGQPLNRVARLLSAGHGGQVLLSQTTYDLARDLLPAAASLQALGEHHLRDLNRPEQVFQLRHPDLPHEFPPLKSLDNPNLPNNLPRQLTSFIGREKEIGQIKSLLGKTSLLTLTGSGGCGKTRLALQVAADVLDQYPDGVRWVELASLADPSLVPQTVASALGLAEQAGKTLVQTLIDYLKSKRLLLLLDNCEHVLIVCAALSNKLLHACPQLTILVTSREGLAIAGEQAYRVPSLALPDPTPTLTVEQVSQYEAVRLFIERASASKADFIVTNASAPALAAVCHRLDGIPLALELAAARVRSLSIEEINIRLDNRFHLLTGGSKTALPRQQTLRALIDWSYNLLSAQERLLLARLSVFAGGSTVEAVEHVCAGEGTGNDTIKDWEVLDLLTGLVDKSLTIAETQGETTRYRLLETVRQYARERLSEIGARDQVRAQHRDYFLELTEQVNLKRQGPEQLHWFEVLEAEHDNLRQAMTFCLETSDRDVAGTHLGSALQIFWKSRGHWDEGRQYLVALAGTLGPEHLVARAKVQHDAGILTWMQGDYGSARALLEECLAVRRDLGDRRGVAASLSNLGLLADVQGDYSAACALYEEGLTIFRDLGDRSAIAASLNNLGGIALGHGDYSAARALYEEGLTIFRDLGDQYAIAASINNLGGIALEHGDYSRARVLFQESQNIHQEMGDKQGIAEALNNLGNVAQEEGNFPEARALIEDSVSLRREMGDKRGVAHALNNLGRAAQDQGDFVEALEIQKESLVIHRHLGDKLGLANSLDFFALLAHEQQQAERAVRLWGAATSLRVTIGFPRPPVWQEKYDNKVAQARSALGEAAFKAAWEAGRAMTLEQALQYALAQTGDKP
jgi:predicted ATPase/class 3 adenylate cyclase